MVGIGNIGNKIARIGKALGMNVLQNDPPLARKTHDLKFVSLDDLMGSDFITIHVPFTRTGQDLTFHLFNDKRLSLMKKGSVLINSSRGGVVDNDALKNNLSRGLIGNVVLDVWENEPKIDLELLAACAIGTPHIAGYSIDGKVNATRMVLQKFCEHFGYEKSVDFSSLISPPQNPIIDIGTLSSGGESILGEAIYHCYDIEKDDAALRKIASVDPSERGTFFKRLRSSYDFRHEFSNYTVRIRGDDEGMKEVFASFGFKVVSNLD